MNREDIIRTAREAHLDVYGLGKSYETFASALERFAYLVAAAEREACAQMAGNYAAANAESDNMASAFLHLATAIRARGEK